MTDFATVTVERLYPLPPARVFAALADRAAMQVWAAPAPEFRTTVEPFDFREGGVALTRMQPPEGEPWINEDRYQEIIPERRIVQTSALRHQGRLLFAGVVVWSLAAEGAGTRVRIEEHGYFPDGRDEAGAHETGWGQILDQLGSWLRG